jgi:hypothetical protein
MQMKSIALISALLSMSCLAASQVPEKEMFPLLITKVNRVNEKGCRAEGESAKVRFRISSDMSAPCAMLRAGETYKAFRAVAEQDPVDETKDSTILVVYDNVKNARRDNAVFSIDWEEAIPRK